ncbi:hypothetical protein ECE50_009165 [Chitinophaga sp. Mgbs1]|uniref:Uncharacterized protein n=1 Tax=Chitinophaga solisilvae TaxID=1233460 RepID=A0A9Q5CXY8_9BACT|nr:hypothetical protein [Chitinophaga solisilvae]
MVTSANDSSSYNTALKRAGVSPAAFVYREMQHSSATGIPPASERKYAIRYTDKLQVLP